ncbi:MarC family protein [Pelagicoccus mobilis]|uniref:UPF0056 membrane protein n=1 Tax=Pelagicoccus mobilis TaxID=415221 RepID=A0A934RX73_9BACT|nr:MarC family protein [Pelagicoccus mobilis]MBK1876869.1 NAAT family transporter [Pelagicoccus mobilis]
MSMGLFEYGLLAFVTLFVIVEPISIAPVFLAMTEGDSREARAKMVSLACSIMLFVLLAFAIAGAQLLDFLGISVAAFQTAGGILLLLISLDMLQARPSRGKISPEESAAGSRKEDVAVTPLAVPLLAGPGAISTVILLANQAESWEYQGVLYAAIVSVCVVSFLVLRLANRGATWLNPLFLRVVTRLAGLLLAALAVQFVFDGLRASGVFS